jgi:hypothetical protein
VISKDADLRKVLSMHKESCEKASSFPEFEDLVKETKQIEGVTKQIVRVDSSLKIVRVESNANSSSADQHSSGDQSRNHVINTERSEISSSSGMFDLNSSQFVNMHRIN